jgi:hypothetical protein
VHSWTIATGKHANILHFGPAESSSTNGLENHSALVEHLKPEYPNLIWSDLICHALVIVF